MPIDFVADGSPNKKRKTGSEISETEAVEIVSTSVDEESAIIVPEVDGADPVMADGQHAIEVTVEMVTVKVVDDTRDRVLQLLERTLQLLRDENELTHTPTTSGSSTVS